MQIRRLDHVSLYVRDVDHSRQFYAQVLGMEEIARPGSFNFPGAWLKKGSAIIHLIGEDTPGRVDAIYAGNYTQHELALGRDTHVAFEVEDLDAAQQHLKAHNIEIVGGPKPRGDGVTQLYVRDPDGYVIELFSW